MPEHLATAFRGLYKLVYNKYFVDEVYDATIVHPIDAGSRTLLWKGVDAGLIDGTVNGVGKRSRGDRQRPATACKSGNIRSYAAWVVLGSVIVIARHRR